MTGRLLFGLGLALAACSGAAAAASSRTELPIREVDLSDGARRYVVDIEIAGRPVEAGLDTGSTGLRVLPRAFPSDATSAPGGKVRYVYASGTRFDGSRIRESVSLGAIGGDVEVMRIDALACASERPRCPVSRVDAARFGIQGDGLPGEGFSAILGIGLKPDPVANPLQQLGVKRWIVELPTPRSPRPGRLILNPADSDLNGYKRVSLIGDGNQIVGCLVPKSLPPICAPSVFDTGAPGIHVFSARPIAPIPQGTPALIAVGDKDSQVTMPVQIGRRDQASGFSVLVRPNANETRISFGIAPYFHWSVLYDASAREIGLRER